MTRTVNSLIERDFENATKDEIEVYAEWTKLLALHSADREQKRKEREKIIEARIEESKQQADAAIEALNALTNLAVAKREAVENEQAK